MWIPFFLSSHTSFCPTTAKSKGWRGIHVCPGQIQSVFPPKTQIPMTTKQKGGKKRERKKPRILNFSETHHLILVWPTVWVLLSPPWSLLFPLPFYKLGIWNPRPHTFPCCWTSILVGQENICEAILFPSFLGCWVLLLRHQLRLCQDRCPPEQAWDTNSFHMGHQTDIK